MTAEIDEKTGRLVELLRREHLGGVLLNAQHNFAWLTGGARNGIDLTRENGAGNLFVTAEGGRYLIANNIEMPRLMAEELSDDDFRAIEISWQEEKESPQLPFTTAAAFADGEIVSDIAIAPGFRQIEGSIAQCRFSLTADEAARIRSLGKDAANAHDNTVARIEPGCTEAEIARTVQNELGAFGITTAVTLVAADERIAQYRHPVPTAKKWDRLVMIVTCAKRHGLLVSISRIICRGPVPDDLRSRTEAAAFVNASLWNATRPGATGKDLYKIAADAYQAVGYADEIDKHHQGGAAGYKTREWVAHPSSTEVVHNHQAFAWNPSITGTKIEDTVLARTDGIEVLTASSLYPSITTEIDGKEYHSPGILSV